MQSFVYILFWLSLAILSYTYVIYGIMIACVAVLRNLLHRPVKQHPQALPDITIVIPAFNEAAVLDKKIQNTLSLDYPTEKTKVIVVTDGSTDGSENIASSFPNVLVLHERDRKGKTAAINRAMELVQSPITLLTDANSLLNAEAIREMLKYYDEPQVGAVAGEKKILATGHSKPVSRGEGLYWTYESTLKKWDAEAYSVMGAAGELFSFRTALYEQMPDDTLLDDLVLSMKICEKGYRIAYAPLAVATEAASTSLEDEWKRKVRIAAGGFQAMARLRVWTYLYRHPMIAFQFLSHRASRWLLCPISLMLLFLSSVLIYSWNDESWFQAIVLAQCIFYGLAALGWIQAKTKNAYSFFYIPFYIVFMHAAAFIGWIAYGKGGQNSLWHKAARMDEPTRN